jgi:hypothetical protein
MIAIAIVGLLILILTIIVSFILWDMRRSFHAELKERDDNLGKVETKVDTESTTRDTKDKEIDATIQKLKSGVQTDKIQLGDKFLMSGVGKDDWLRVMDKDGKNYYGGVAANKLWSGTETHLNGVTNVNGSLNIRGGQSEHNPNKAGTHFPWSGDNKNYIRGDTEIRGNTNNIGDLNVGRHVNISGNLAVRGSLNTGRHIDAQNDWGGKGTTLFTGWNNSKTVIGNWRTNGHDFAFQLPANTVVSTNPMYVKDKLCIDDVCIDSSELKTLKTKL